MPCYRLIGDHGEPAGEFDAPDDPAAGLLGRRLSNQVPTARTTGFRVERLEDGRWRSVLAWMPARVRRYPVPMEATVPAPAPAPETPSWVRSPR